MDAWAMPRRAGVVDAYASHIRGLTALGQADFETAFRNAAAISPPGRHPRPYAPHALWVFHDLVESAARDCRLDRLSPRLQLVVLAGAAITRPGTTPPPWNCRRPSPSHRCRGDLSPWARCLPRRVAVEHAVWSDAADTPAARGTVLSRALGCSSG
ncbi:MAG TPA: hypothetical protein VF070_27775, partial [Streptosporangiaceae bacterium]